VPRDVVAVDVDSILEMTDQIPRYRNKHVTEYHLCSIIFKHPNTKLPVQAEWQGIFACSHPFALLLLFLLMTFI